MNQSERATMQDMLDALENIVNANPRKWQELSEPMGEFERWAKSRANHAAIKLRAALAQPEPDYMLRPGDKIPETMWRKGEFAEDGYPMPTKVEFAARGTLASLKCWHRLTQEESDDLVKMFAAKELTCTWTQDADGYYSTQCGEAYVFNDGTPAQNNAYYCHHCGGKLIEEKVRQG